MKLSLSHIAWSLEENDTVVDIMHRFGVTGVDIAPSKLFSDPMNVSDEAIAEIRTYWNSRGITIAGAQSLHFGFPDLQLFGTPEQRQAFIDHTKAMIRLMGRCGATALVFGSPKNRVKGALTLEQAIADAVPVLRDLGQTAIDSGTAVCVEPNAEIYGCDFITNTTDAITLVEAVNHPGFRLHLDTGTMQLMNEDPVQAIHDAAQYLHHFHVSEPMLEPVGVNESHTDFHTRAATTLRDIRYAHWVAVEMKDGATKPNTRAVETAAQFVQTYYS